jgi:hypothetical protein
MLLETGQRYLVFCVAGTMLLEIKPMALKQELLCPKVV